LFPDDGTFMWKGIDLIEATSIVPFELNPPMKLGKLTLNRNPTNFFAEPESISFAPSNVVDGISFVPDPLLQWRLMSYDDTCMLNIVQASLQQLIARYQLHTDTTLLTVTSFQSTKQSLL
jgi:catalase